MTVVTSNGVGGPWNSGKEEVNNNNRRKQNAGNKQSKGKKK